MKGAFCFSLLLCLFVPCLGTSAQDDGFLVIVNRNNDTEEINIDRLSSIFLKKISKWEDGSSIEPVDQDASSPVRDALSRSAHKRSVASIKNYWQRQIFSGRETPPPELGSDEQVVQFVSTHPRSIGYVSTGAMVEGVKVLRITE